MTYLEAVNGVLRRLREAEVSTVEQKTYSKLIGTFVNDARDYVLSRWDWLSLEETIDITTADGTAEYTIDGAGDKAYVERFIDTTNNNVLVEVDMDWIRRQTEIPSTASSAPYYYAMSGVASDLDPKVTFYPTPAGVYTIKAYVDKSGVTLSDDTDTLGVPDQAVVQFAYALALDERGETGGTAARRQYEIAEIYIANAVMADAAKRPAETVYTVEGENYLNQNWHSRIR